MFVLGLVLGELETQQKMKGLGLHRPDPSPVFCLPMVDRLGYLQMSLLSGIVGLLPCASFVVDLELSA